MSVFLLGGQVYPVLLKTAMEFRKEQDSFGQIEVPKDRLWGAQTARSLHFFAIGQDKMPKALIHALGLIKAAAAQVNQNLGVLEPSLAGPIMQAAQEIASGSWDQEFPLSIWQTGSGTQTNMNANEVIANLANRSLGQPLGSKKPIHPHDHVNCSQSSNDVFPTAMHIAAAHACVKELVPEAKQLAAALSKKAIDFKKIVKIGRTHLMDAVPLTLGQEFSGYAQQVNDCIEAIEATLPKLYALAIGGTAVGTGINAPADFGSYVARLLAEKTGLPFYSAPNKFASLASHEALVFASGSLRTLACALMKIANDLRWMGSGPRCGISELLLPANEPGSSIMPGKVNPTQCEALTMICIQVLGNDTTIAFAGTQGNFELNVFKPLIIHNFLHSTTLLTEGMRSFRKHLIEGIEPNTERITELLDRSLMLITALTPVIGYDACTRIALKAHRENITLRQAALELKVISPELFDKHINEIKNSGFS